MAARIIELKAQKAELKGQLLELLKAAETDKRPLKAEEAASADGIQKNLDLVLATLKHEETRLALEREDEPANPAASEEPAKEPAKKKGDWLMSFGEFLQDVKALYGGKLDAVRAAASGLNTSVPSEGGVLVRTDFSTQLLARAQEESQLLGKCSSITIGEEFDGIELPYVEETSRATGSRWGGVQVFRRAEAETVNATKPKLGKIELRLEDLMAICYATDRTARDARALAEIVSKAFASEFGFKIDDEIIRGTGVGQMLGILNSPSLVSQAAEGGQTADTVVAGNAQKMFARIPARLLKGAEWLIGNEVWPQFFAMNQANMPVFMPGTSMANAPYGMLLGRPITPIEQAAAIGDVGDILLTNLSEYLVIQKGGLQIAESMHVRFIYGENTFRFTYPINGAPAWKSATTAYKGAFSLSPFVALAAR